MNLAVTNAGSGNKISLIAILMWIMIFIIPVMANADEKTALPDFIDYDGDGFNDNLSDIDENKIPDSFENNISKNDKTSPSLLGDVFNNSPSINSQTALYFSAMEAFLARESRARCLSIHRTGFTGGEVFGPGNGIGTGSSSSACEGGVCGKINPLLK